MEKDNAIQTIIEEVFSRYTDGSYIKASMLPDLDLYVDQITTFLTRHLSKTTRFEDDKIMTKTMINNYTKNHLLPPPDRKKYSRDHILLMIFIYYFKNFLPISDIQTILGPLTDKYFHKDTELNLESIYTTLFSKETYLYMKYLRMSWLNFICQKISFLMHRKKIRNLSVNLPLSVCFVLISISKSRS